MTTIYVSRGEIDARDHHMNIPESAVSTVDALVAATKNKCVQRIVVSGHLADAPSVSLSPGQSLRGAAEQSAVTIAAGIDGLRLSSDNRVHSIRLDASSNKRAIFNDTTVATLGRIELRGITTTGCVQILARDNVRSGHVEVSGLVFRRSEG